MFLVQEAKATGKPEADACSGFAFSAKAPADEQCVTYTGPITELEKQDVNWSCFSMSLKTVKYDKTTQPPPAIQALTELTQNLHLREVFAGAPASMTTAKLLQIQPQAGDDSCFPAAWWFNIQDMNGVPASIPVDEAEWDQLMASLPLPVPDH